jgi:hypothetical protein
LTSEPGRFAPFRWLFALQQNGVGADWARLLRGLPLWLRQSQTTARGDPMPVTLHQVSVKVFVQGLTGLALVMDKAAAHAAERSIDPNAYLQARLFPDMFNLTRQVQIAADFAKGGAARLAGAEPPTYADDETSFEALKARIEKTIAYIESLDPADIDGQEERQVSLVRRGETTVHRAQDYLLKQALPNFYFHVTTAYAILRHNGVAIGKRDFLGA